MLAILNPTRMVECRRDSLSGKWIERYAKMCCDALSLQRYISNYVWSIITSIHVPKDPPIYK